MKQLTRITLFDQHYTNRPIVSKIEITKNTSLGAIKEDRVMVFSGKGPGLALEIATMTKQSPEGTAFTLPLYHPVVPLAADAILQLFTTKTKR